MVHDEAGTASVAEIGLNPFAPGYFDDPYAQYRALRAVAPVHQSPIGPWTVTRYDDCSRLLRDPTLVGRGAQRDGDAAQRRPRGRRHRAGRAR